MLMTVLVVAFIYGLFLDLCIGALCCVERVLLFLLCWDSVRMTAEMNKDYY